ncbi:signal peptidase I [Sandaracinobacter neustonicus]|nr:signal peptidase I [Sandaracinobacter neustonicus]
MESSEAIEAARARHLAGSERLAQWLWPFTRLLLLALTAALLLRVLIVQPFAIPSSSMAPTLQAGDFVLVDKKAYGWARASLPLAADSGMAGDGGGRLFASAIPHGDVIAFVGPDGRDYVKRMIARGGETVELRNGLVLLNGVPLPCVPQNAAADGQLCREAIPSGRTHLSRDHAQGPRASFGPVTVPAGHLFVLGDNRGHSADSRVPAAEGGIGFVPEDKVIGRAARIFFAYDRGVRWNRIGTPVD